MIQEHLYLAVLFSWLNNTMDTTSYNDILQVSITLDPFISHGTVLTNIGNIF